MSGRFWQVTIIIGLCLAVIYVWSVVGDLLSIPEPSLPSPTSTHIPPLTPTPYPENTLEPASTPTPGYGDNVGACLICRRFVKDGLKAPRDAKWPLCSETATGFDRHSKSWNVASYVDSPNIFGVMLRLQYICEVEHLGGDKWRLLDLDFMP